MGRLRVKLLLLPEPDALAQAGVMVVRLPPGLSRSASVLAVDRCPDALVETMALVAPNEDKILSHICDVTDADQMKAMIDACQKYFGGLDILVNNVGGSARCAVDLLLTHGRRK